MSLPPVFSLLSFVAKTFIGDEKMRAGVHVLQ